jgi:hypothetical protein
MTFNQWWGSLKWSFAARILVEPLAKLFSEIAWNAAVRAEREACAEVCDAFESDADPDAGAVLAKAIRARGRA